MSVLLYDNPVSGNCYEYRLILTLLGIAQEPHGGIGAVHQFALLLMLDRYFSVIAARSSSRDFNSFAIQRQ